MPSSPPDILTICYLCDDAGIDFTLTRVGYDFLLPEHRWVCRIGNDDNPIDIVRGFGTDASAAVEDAYQRALAATILPPTE